MSGRGIHRLHVNQQREQHQMNERVLVWMDVMGRRQRGPMSPADAVTVRRLAVQRRVSEGASTRKAKAALADYEGGRGTAEAAIEAITARVRYCNSHDRLGVMLKRLAEAPREIFWPVFCDYWSACEETWWLRDPLLHILRMHAPAIMPNQKVFDALPERVQVFRGCSRERIAGLSWTTERHVAERFAHGHRGIPVPDPVVATGTIARPDIFVVISDRNESEVLLDPDRLTCT
jgi:hypothetical protein